MGKLMCEKSTDKQRLGIIGEAAFQQWAAKMGWHPSKLDLDYGLQRCEQNRNS